MLGSYVTALIRTLAGYAAGLVVALPIAPAIEASVGVTAGTAAAGIAAGTTFVVGTLYYAGVRALEHKWPAAGVLLGVPSQPSYTPPTLGRHAADPLGEVVTAAGGRLEQVDETDTPGTAGPSSS